MKVKKVFVLFLKVTEKCNLFCDHCYVLPGRKQGGVFLDTELASEIIFRLYRHLCRNGNLHLHVVFHGGEPLLMGRAFYEDIYARWKLIENDLNRESRDSRVSFSIMTNLLLYDSSYDWIVKNLFNGSIGTSFDITRKTSKGFGDFYKKWIKKYEEVKSKFSVFLGITVSKKTLDFPVKFWVNKLKELDPDSFDFYWYVPRLDLQEKDELFVSWDEYVSFLMDFVQLWFDSGGNILKLKVVKNFVESGRFTFSGNSACAESHFVIDPGGDVHICPAVSGQGNFFLTGNIFRDSVNSILKSPIRISLISDSYSVPAQCLSCDYVSMCNSGCLLFKKLGLIKGNKCRSFFDKVLGLLDGLVLQGVSSIVSKEGMV